MGDLSPDLERVVEAMAIAAYGDVLPSWDVIGEENQESLREDQRAALRAALAVRAQCGTCGDTGTVCCGACDCGNDPRARRDGAYYCERCKQTGVEPCPDCVGGGAPLPVLVPSAQLEQVGQPVFDADGNEYPRAIDNAAYSCSICGYHPLNTSIWCHLGCGRGYNRMNEMPLYVLAPSSVDAPQDGER